MINGSTVLGLIIARGGSKGLPGKNILDLGGKPLIAWSVEAARQSRVLDRLVVSTDDEAIMEAARAAGGEIPFRRPPELATDQTSAMDVVIHALDNVGAAYDYVVLLQATSPFRTSDDIDQTIAACVDNQAPCCVTIAEVSKSPYWMFSLDTARHLVPLIPQDQMATQRQALPQFYALNGAVYVARVDWLRCTKQFVTPETIGHIMRPEHSIDVDTAFDLRLAQSMLSAFGQERIPS